MKSYHIKRMITLSGHNIIWLSLYLHLKKIVYDSLIGNCPFLQALTTWIVGLYQGTFINDVTNIWKIVDPSQAKMEYFDIVKCNKYHFTSYHMYIKLGISVSQYLYFFPVYLTALTEGQKPLPRRLQFPTFRSEKGYPFNY